MNNIYVDELPKRCLDCVCLNKVNGRCQLKHIYIDTDLEPIDCPLKLITDRLAEERQKVVQELKSWCDKNFNWVSDGTNNTINKLREKLNQIEGASDDNK